MMIRIILIQADDNEREITVSLISAQEDMMIQESGKDDYDAIKLVRKFKPDIVLIDASAEISEGLDISCILKRDSPATAVVLLCGKVNKYLIRKMANGIIKNFLLKESDMGGLAIILRGVHMGKNYINSQISASVIKILADDNCGKKRTAGFCEKTNYSSLADLSTAELKILKYIAEGHDSRDIAGFLSFSEGTIRNYISSIKRKTKLENRTQIVLFAQENGFGKENTG